MRGLPGVSPCCDAGEMRRLVQESSCVLDLQVQLELSRMRGLPGVSSYSATYTQANAAAYSAAYSAAYTAAHSSYADTSTDSFADTSSERHNE